MTLALAQTSSLTLPKPHTGGQRALYRHPARFQVVACGRRWGKTLFGEIVVSEALFPLAADVWWVSPTYKMASTIWREFSRVYRPYMVWSNASDHIMELSTGATLTIWTGEAADTMRGGAPGLVVIDEAAMIRNVEMWPAVIRPALSDKQGRAFFLSTPRGHNWFWELFNKGNDPLFPQYKSWNFPSWFRPGFPAGEKVEAQMSLPDRLFRQEYGAEFIPDAGGVFRGVETVSTADIVQEPYEGNFSMGVDWGKSNDFTVISVMDRDTRRQVDVDRFNQIGWSLQRGRLITLYEKWKPQIIWAEHNSFGDPNIEALQAEGLPVHSFVTTAQSKGPLIEMLAAEIERKNVTLLNDRVQIAELQAYEMERLPSGIFRYNAPDGGHDDMVIALALSLYGAVNIPGNIVGTRDW